MNEAQEDIEIGTGATALVFRRLNSRGAWECEKVLLPKFRGKIDFESSLRREFEILESARHPYIISAVSLRSHQDARFGIYHGLVSNWVEGWKLSEIYSWSSRFNLEFRKEWARILYRQLLVAVQHLESKGIVHGDLCPENILVGRDGFIRLVDFGSARRLDLDSHLMALDSGHPPFTASTGRYQLGGDRYSVGKLLEYWMPDAFEPDFKELLSDLCEKRIWREDLLRASAFEPLPLFPFSGALDAKDSRLPQTRVNKLSFRWSSKWVAAVLPVFLSSWAPRATLSINSFPLGRAELVVNGERQILSLPLDRISLRPGFHEIILTHPSVADDKHEYHVELKSGREYKIFEDFQKVDTLKSWTKASNKM